MSYCKFHPMMAATHYCPGCSTNLCDQCCAEDPRGKEPRCMLCEERVQNLGITADAEPFWRHFEAAFRYPIRKSVIGLIIVISLLSTASTALFWPIMVGVNLLLSGIMIKYCFTCLNETALGQTKAPDISQGFEGGVTILLRMFLAIVAMVFFIGFVGRVFGPTLAAFADIFIIAALPAMIILYAMSESMAEALNPLKLISLMASIGIPYLALMGILIVMMGSVDLLSSLLASFEPMVAFSLQSAVSNYYSIVVFHLMGYMIFQYQHRLGFVATAEKESDGKQRTAAEQYLARADILIKEGRFDDAGKLFDKAIKECPKDDTLQQRYFRFVLALMPGMAAKSDKVIEQYLNYLIAQRRFDQLYINYKQAILAAPDYVPGKASLRHEIAQACINSGNPKRAVKLLNGLHKQFPDYKNMSGAYQVLARALNDIPGMEERAAQCIAFARKLADQTATSTDASLPDTPNAAVSSSNNGKPIPLAAAARPSGPAVFTSKDPSNGSTAPASRQAVNGATDKDQITPKPEDDNGPSNLPPIEFS